MSLTYIFYTVTPLHLKRAFSKTRDKENEEARHVFIHKNKCMSFLGVTCNRTRVTTSPTLETRLHLGYTLKNSIKTKPRKPVPNGIN